MFLATEGFKNIVLSSDQRKGFLRRLEFVEVKDCGDICTLFSAKLRQALKNLKSVKILSCKSLEGVFELEEEDEESEEEEMPLLSSLTRLELQGLPELKCIWKGSTGHVSLRSLIHLNLRFVHKLTSIFPPSLDQSLPQLETLEIRDCRELKHIIGEITPESHGLPKLKTLYISDCGKLESVIPVSVYPSLLNLIRMTISYAYNLKQIFYGGEESSNLMAQSQVRPLYFSTNFFFLCNLNCRLQYIVILFNSFFLQISKTEVID